MLRITGYVSRFKANILAKDELNEIKFDNLIFPGTKESKKGWLIFEKAFAVNKEKISQVVKLKVDSIYFKDEENLLPLETRISGIGTFSYNKKYPILMNVIFII